MEKWLKRISGKELKLFSIFSMILLFGVAVFIGNFTRLAEGIWLIIVSRDALITDYFELAGYGAAFLNAALVMGISIFFIITMYFGGGMVPTYLIVKHTGLINNIWALFLPGGVAVGNMIIVRNFFENSIPKEMTEAAQIDGASKWKTFIQIVVPLSRSIMAVMVVFSMVAYWNDWFTSLIYLPSPERAPLPLVLRNILIKSSASASQASTISGGFAELNKMTEMIKFSSIIIAALPMLVIYPFVQKYFEKGFMAGAVKG